MRCTICGSEITTYRCPVCGYDLSRNREQYPTLTDKGEKAEAVWVIRNKWFERLYKQQTARPAAIPSDPARPLTLTPEAAPEPPPAPAPTPAPAHAQHYGQKASLQQNSFAAKPSKKKRTLWLIPAAALLALGLFIGINAGSKRASQGSEPQAAVRASTETPVRTEGRRQTPIQTQPEIQTQPVQQTTEAPVYEPPQVGQTVYFGSYEQDDRQNGREPLEWIVLSTDGSSALLLSKYGLERRTYTDYERNATWADSDLRSWLNGEFLIETFTESEQSRLLPQYHHTAINPQYPELDAGMPVTDRVFLLSYEEAETLLPTANARKCVPTQHLVNQGAFVNEGCCWWWLRNPGEGQIFVMGVSSKGAIHYAGNEDYLPGSVRPAIVVRYS